MEITNKEDSEIFELIEITKSALIKEYPDIKQELIEDAIARSVVENFDFTNSKEEFYQKTSTLLKKVLKDNKLSTSSGTSGIKNFDPVNIYLKQIDSELLSQNEERELLIEASNGNIEARNKIVEKNQKLVLSIAKKYVMPNVMLSDLIQEANIGLMKAVSRFDISKGFRFSTYAYIWIVQAIQKYTKSIRFSLKFSNSMNEQIYRYNKEYNNFCNTYYREPTLEEMASILNVSIEKIKEIKKAIFFSTSISLNERVSGDDNSDSCDEIEMFLKDDSIKIEELSCEHDKKRAVVTLLNNSGLTEQEKKIIIKRYGLDGSEPATLAEIASIFGCSRERIRQKESKALQKLRKSEYISSLCEYMDNPDECKKKITPQPKKKKTIKRDIVSIYNAFSKYNSEDVNTVLQSLSEQERNTISLKYSSDLYKAQPDKEFKLRDKRLLTNTIIPKIGKELEKLQKEREAKERKEKILAAARAKKLEDKPKDLKPKNTDYDISMIESIIDRVKSRYKDYLTYIKSSYFEILKEELKNIPLNSLDINPNIYLITVAENLVIRELCKKCGEGNIDLEIAMVEKYRNLTNFIIRKKEIEDKAEADDVIISAISSYDGKCSFSLHISEILKKYNQKQKILK